MNSGGKRPIAFIPAWRGAACRDVPPVPDAWPLTPWARLQGRIGFLDSAEPALLLEPTPGEQSLLRAFNVAGRSVRHRLPEGCWQALTVPGPDAGHAEAGPGLLPAHGICCARRV